MPHPQLDRFRLGFKPLASRANKLTVAHDMVAPGSAPAELPPASLEAIRTCASRIRQAREKGRPVMIAFGAHTIKNGLGPVLIDLMERGWLQHLATNGAGIIHDWEFAFQGKSSEDVRANVAKGEFGMWQETGYYLNLAIRLGAFDGLGYGESVGRMIATEKLTVPAPLELQTALVTGASNPDRAGAAAEVLQAIQQFKLVPGDLAVPHPHKQQSVQAAAWRLAIPFTSHPMIGHDIIYEHPMNSGAAIGRAAQRDFLAFAHNVSQLDGGVYLSIGSAVMSPMIFEKSVSMAQNLALQDGHALTNHFIQVVDLAPSRWDWSKGEPPMDSPDYYLRYCKTFNRMGGTMNYLTADNRDFLLALARELC